MAKKIISGIYCIQNKVNGKRYIGKAVDLDGRLAQHRSFLNNKDYEHENNHLINAYCKYGKENFEYIIIEECDKEVLSEREKYWIAFYDSRKNGYNKTDGGDGGSGLVGEDCHTSVLTEEDVKDIIKRIQQGDYDSNIVKDYGVTKSSISAIRNHKNWKHLTEGLDFPDSEGMHLRERPKVSVDMYDEDGTLIKTFDSIRQAGKEMNIDYKSISLACHGKKRMIGGYIWRLHNHPFDEFHTNNRSCRSINQCDIDGKIICNYKSIKEIIEITGIERSKIHYAISKGIKLNGYYWSYADKKDEGGDYEKVL